MLGWSGASIQLLCQGSGPRGKHRCSCLNLPTEPRYISQYARESTGDKFCLFNCKLIYHLPWCTLSDLTAWDWVQHSLPFLVSVVLSPLASYMATACFSIINNKWSIPTIITRQRWARNQECTRRIHSFFCLPHVRRVWTTPPSLRFRSSLPIDKSSHPRAQWQQYRAIPIRN